MSSFTEKQAGSPEKRNVCIVGAGILGIATAYYLLQSKRCGEITLLEEGEPAGGASGKVGGLLTTWTVGTTDSLGKLSYELHEQLSQELEGETRYGYAKTPAYTMSVKKGTTRQLELFNKQRQSPISRKEDPTTAWLNPKNVTIVDPLYHHIGSAQVEPEELCKVLLQECVKGGVKVVKGRAERALSQHCRRTKGAIITTTIQHSNGQIENVDVIVLCTGAWSTSVAKELFSIDIAIHSLPAHSILLKPSKPLPALFYLALVEDGDDQSTESPEILSRPNGTVHVVGEFSGPPLPASTSEAALVQHSSSNSLARLYSSCQLISPLLFGGKDCRVKEGESLFFMAGIPREAPYVCKLPHQDHNVYLAAVHGQQVITLGPGVGKVMSEVILDGMATSADISGMGL